MISSFKHRDFSRVNLGKKQGFMLLFKASVQWISLRLRHSPKTIASSSETRMSEDGVIGFTAFYKL